MLHDENDIPNIRNIGIVIITFDVNPLTAGLGRISPRHFLNCPYKKPVNLKIWKKYLFLGKCISYHLSLGDFIEKCRFPIVLGAFLGLIKKKGPISPTPDDDISSVFYIEALESSGVG
jgi:hypothetical protein